MANNTEEVELTVDNILFRALAPYDRIAHIAVCGVDSVIAEDDGRKHSCKALSVGEASKLIQQQALRGRIDELEHIRLVFTSAKTVSVKFVDDTGEQDIYNRIATLEKELGQTNGE